MSAQAAAATAPTGQATLPGVVSTTSAPAATGSVAAPAPTTGDGAPASALATAATGEGTTADGGLGQEAGGSKDVKPDQAAELQIKLPDGVTADAATLKEFAKVAKEAGLTSESASKLAAWNLERRDAEAKASQADWVKQGEAWRAELEKDAEVGGPKWAETQAAWRRAWARFGDKDALAAIEGMGLGNHPAIMKLMARVGRSIKEDDSATPQGGKTSAVSDEQALLDKLYPSMAKKRDG